jgi:hypothetical protein
MSGIARRMMASIVALAMAGGFVIGLGAQATPASASPIVIGQSKTDGTLCNTPKVSPGLSQVQVATAPGAPSYVVPAGLNEITSWSTQAGPNGGSMELEVWRATATPDTFSLVGIGSLEKLKANQLNQFTLSPPIAVKTGDLLGSFEDGANCLAQEPPTPNGDRAEAEPVDTPPALGTTQHFHFPAQRVELNIAATLASPPSIAKAFAPSSIILNGTTALTFTLTNPNPTAPQTGVGFTDTLPAGLVVANPNGASTTCHDPKLRPAADPGSSTITVSQGSLQPAETCTATVSIQGNSPGVFTNTTSAVTSDQGTGNTALANLTVVGPPVISKSFGASSIRLGASTSLTFTLKNPNPTAPLSGISFSDTLPRGLVVATPDNGLTGSCFGTIVAGSDSSAISLAGGAIPASGSCNFSVDVIGIRPGNQVNVTGRPASKEAGMGETATASVTVDDCPAGQTANLLRATTNLGTVLGAFCVDPATASGTYTQGTASGTALLSRSRGTTQISATGNNLLLTGVMDKSTNNFVETLPLNVTGTFDLDKN